MTTQPRALPSRLVESRRTHPKPIIQPRASNARGPLDVEHVVLHSQMGVELSLSESSTGQRLLHPARREGQQRRVPPTLPIYVRVQESPPATHEGYSARLGPFLSATILERQWDRFEREKERVIFGGCAVWPWIPYESCCTATVPHVEWPLAVVCSLSAGCGGVGPCNAPSPPQIQCLLARGPLYTVHRVACIR